MLRHSPAGRHSEVTTSGARCGSPWSCASILLTVLNDMQNEFLTMRDGQQCGEKLPSRTCAHGSLQAHISCHSPLVLMRQSHGPSVGPFITARPLPCGAFARAMPCRRCSSYQAPHRWLLPCFGSPVKSLQLRGDFCGHPIELAPHCYFLLDIPFPSKHKSQCLTQYFKKMVKVCLYY